jgi:hypothetical protein
MLAVTNTVDFLVGDAVRLHTVDGWIDGKVVSLVYPDEALWENFNRLDVRTIDGVVHPECHPSCLRHAEKNSKVSR